MWKYLIGGVSVHTQLGYEFKMTNSFEKRKAESMRMKNKYPDKIPIIIEKAEASQLPGMQKQKYLMQNKITIGQLLYIIRKQINISPTESIFLIINNSNIPSTSATVGDIYNQFADKDGFLYITYSSQQTFG